MALSPDPMYIEMARKQGCAISTVAITMKQASLYRCNHTSVPTYAWVYMYA